MGRRKAKGHLYLAFDDWDFGYTIRKVRLSLGSDSGERSGEGAKQPLPGVFTRIWAPRARGLPRYFAAAFGTKILSMHLLPSDITGIPIINVKDQSFYFGPQPSCFACPIYFPIGDDRLFALDIGTFDVCFGFPDTTPWVWHPVTHPPFGMHEVSSYTVQPDGCILVSTKSSATGATVTFIFNTKDYIWKQYGDWAFPFTGCGHYDPSLDAFVGLSNDPETLGYLYSCTMDSTGAGDTGNILLPSPDSKCNKETVYSTNPAERHVSATLVHMHWNKFCLVECVDTRPDEELLPPELLDRGELLDLGTDWEALEMGTESTDEDPLELGTDEELLEPMATVGDRFMYRLKTFSLRYDANGDLKLEQCRVRCYSVPRETTIAFTTQDPVAFWL